MKQSILKQLLRRPLGLGMLLILGFLYLCALFAPFLAPYEASTQNLQKSFHPPSSFTWVNGKLHIEDTVTDPENPTEYLRNEGKTIPLKFFAKGYPYKILGLIAMDRHWVQVETDEEDARIYLLGSDGTGRDVFSRLLYGSRVSLSIGLIGISITMILGFLVGGLSGYFGGKFDFMSMRVVELLMAIPGLYLLLALRSALAPHFESNQMYIVIIIILSLVGWAGTGRIIRGMSLSLSQRTFILAAQGMGQSTYKILLRHILPNLISYLLVSATLSIPAYILGEAALSFLGLGIQEPSASWGLMLKQAQEMKVFMLNFWWMFTPGILIFVTVIAFNILGDALRDIEDSKMNV